MVDGTFPSCSGLPTLTLSFIFSGRSGSLEDYLFPSSLVIRDLDHIQLITDNQFSSANTYSAAAVDLALC